MSDRFSHPCSRSIRASAALFLVALSAAGVGVTARAQTLSPDPSTYPAEVQQHYRVFAAKCRRCHDLSRPLGASYATETQWREVVRRMARMPGAAISPAEQGEIVRFLVYHVEVRAGRRRANGDGDPAPPDAVAKEPVAVTQEGVRIEARVRGPQSLRRLRGGRWVVEAPRGDATLYLAVRVLDAETGDPLPYAELSVRVLASVGAPSVPLLPAFGAEGFHYGANLSAPAGRVRLSITIDPPSVAQVGDAALKLTRPVTVDLELPR